MPQTDKRKVEERIKDRLEHLRKLLPVDESTNLGTILDWGCGNGEISVEIGSYYHAKELLVCDIFSPEKFVSPSSDCEIKYF